MMHLGLEWLFRFFQEPTQLWRRYLINNPLFVVRAAEQMLSLRK
jgi:N-acetylglucosaminyldiphosphoundecaprenol N-acetyl-beta-D-mannosaminyltransferase